MIFKRYTAEFILVILSVSGCSTINPVELDKFRPLESSKRIINVPLVDWQVRDDAVKICRYHFPGSGACAFWDKSKKTCTIITSSLTNDVFLDVILGHELRHCFEGKFHN